MEELKTNQNMWKHIFSYTIRMIRLFKPHVGLNDYVDKGMLLLRSCLDLLSTP